MIIIRRGKVRTGRGHVPVVNVLVVHRARGAFRGETGTAP